MSRFAKNLLRRGLDNAEAQPLIYNSFNVSEGPVSSNEDENSDDSTETQDSRIPKSPAKLFEDERVQWVYWMDSNPLTKWWDIFDLLLTLFFIVNYIYLTNYSIGERDTPFPPPPPPQIIEDIDFTLAISLFLIFVPRILLSVYPWEEIKSYWSICTVLSCFSVIFVYFNPAQSNTFLEGGNAVFLYPFRFWRIHGSVNRVFPIGKKGFFKISAVNQKAYNLVLSIFSTILVVTAWTHIVLYKFQKFYDLYFLEVFYTITMSSFSGLATNIVPDNTFSRIVTFGIMVVGAIYLPTQLSDLITLVRSQSQYNRSYRPSKGRSHVIVVGNLEIVALRGFLREFYSTDHGSKTLTTNVVLVNSYEPGSELEQLLADPIYSNRVKYVKGSAMSFRSLRKAKVESAKAAFVLTSRISDCDTIDEDAKTVMRCVSLRKFHRGLKIFAQILLPRNKVHLESLADNILCIDEFKLGMAAQSCLSPGFTTIMYILTNSISERAVNHLSGYGKTSPWMQEYLHGALMELYEIKLDMQYSGMKFSEAVLAVYKHHNAILFGLGLDCAPGEEGTFGADQKIIFNPEGYVLKGGERAFMITDESRNARRVGRFDFRNDNVDHLRSFWNPQKLSRHVESNLKMPLPPSRNYSSKLRRDESGSLESMTGLGLKAKLDFTIVSNKKRNEKLDQLGDVEEEVKEALPISVDISKEFPKESSSLQNNVSGIILDSKKLFKLGHSLPSTVKGHM